MLLFQYAFLMLIVVNFANPPMKFPEAVECSPRVVTLRWWSLWVQARMSSVLAASAQTPGKATPPISAAGRHLSALLQCESSLGSLSSCPRSRTSPFRVVVTGSRSATSTRSNCGSEASPGTPPALDLSSPARALSNTPRAVGRFSMAIPSDAVVKAAGIQLLSHTVPFWTLVSSPIAPSPPRPISSNLKGSLLGARAFGYTPTAPFA